MSLFQDIEQRDDAVQQEFDLFRKCLAMTQGETAGWYELIDLVDELLLAQAVAETGVPHGKIKANRIRENLKVWLQELRECRKPLGIFTTAEGGAK